MSIDPPRLLLVTDPDVGDPVAATRHALVGLAGRGRRDVAVQLRAKEASGRTLFRLGRALRTITTAAGALLVVNGRMDVARACAADGVHLPEDGVSPTDARAMLGPKALVGVSRHDADGVTRAASEGADYATLSPFASTPGKGAPLGPEGFAAAVASARLPVLALGGIDAENARSALEAGAFGVAVIRAVYAAADPASAVGALLAVLDSTPSGGR